MEKRRINFNVPVSLIPAIKLLCDQQGVTAAYWLRKALIRAVEAGYDPTMFHSEDSR